MPSKEELKSAIHAAFDAAVPDGASYTKVYGADIRQQNFVIFRRTIVRNYAVGFKAGETDLVVLPIDKQNDQITAGTPVTVTAANRESVKKRDLQGRFVIKTTDGQSFKLAIMPSVPKVLAAAYQLPVEQKAEYEAFTAVRDALVAN